MAETEGKAGFHEKAYLAKRLSNNGKLGSAQPHQSPKLTCPECGNSEKIFKDGWRKTNQGSVQRFLCVKCGYRFSDPGTGTKSPRGPQSHPSFNGSDMTQHVDKIHRQNLKSHASIPNPRQVCYERNDSRKECGSPAQMKHNGGRRADFLQTWRTENLAEVTRQEEPMREGTADVKGKIVEFMWKMQKNGRRLSTLKNYGRVLNVLLNSGVNLLDAEEVKAYLASAEIKLSSKKQYTDTLKVFYKTLGIQWQPPEYKGEPEIPFIPTEKELDQFVAAVGKKLGTFLQLLKETGARPGEIQRLTWTDIDFERRTVRIKPLKGSLPRILPISLKAIEMLKNLPKKSERIFARVIYGTFDKQRRNAAKKLANPRILQIHFHTFRHWKATMEYHKTKDILYVKQLLGHKNIQNTLIYITIEKALFQHGLEEEFHVRVAQKPEEIKAFLEAGFDYVLQKDGLAFFRKRK